jgi:hypothetical protein
MVNSVELIGTAGYLTLYAWCGINRCRYNRVDCDLFFLNTGINDGIISHYVKYFDVI